ncbi:MAG: gas vesicle protein GvpD P-loop domain-containing protein [Candidatus Jordarchaeaceae archaeon]
MRNPISIPKEIEQFLSQKESVSLMIKGSPGTGKSILALSTIKSLGLTESFYLTTRVKPQRLVSDFPWIRDMLFPEHIVDATATIFPSSRVDVEGKISFGALKIC